MLGAENTLNSSITHANVRNAGRNAESEFFRGALQKQMSLGEIFSIVKRAVREVTGKERSGVGLMLSPLPSMLGAFWQVGGNYIVANEVLFKAMKNYSEDPLVFNSFAFVILSHEYLHAVGYLDEMQARRVTAQVAQRCFGEDHEVTKLAKGDIWSIYPFLKYLPGGRGERFSVVSGFDSDSTKSYIT